MFDVSWSDPTQETVGQRRSRREHQQNAEPPGIQRRESSSNDSFAAKRRPSLLTLFNGSRKDFARPISQANVSAPGRPAPVSRDRSGTRVGAATDTVAPIQELELPAGPMTPNEIVDRFLVTDLSDVRSRTTYSPSDEPTFTSWASGTASTDSTWSSNPDSPRKSHFVQPLSPTSFVTQKTEITVALRDDVEDNEQNVTIVHISADNIQVPETRDLPPRLSPSSSTSEFRVPEFQLLDKNFGLSSPNNVITPPSSDKYTITKMGQANPWKPPRNWNCPSVPLPPPKSSARPPWRPSSVEDSPAGSNVLHVQKSLRRMQAASSKIMLERLKEEWMDVTDATIFRELDFEKRLWMRSALHASAKQNVIDGNSRGYAKELKPELPLGEGIKILSLYENHASTAFLSFNNSFPLMEIHHISTNPLSSTSQDGPVIYPLNVPSPTPQLPYAPSLFSSIHASFSLPALLPSSALPTLLKECHRVLRKRGSLHMTLIDPCPVATSTGPKLREWLDTHLLLNLERQFRCTNPSRLIPGWITDAGFAACDKAGAGSTTTRIRFAAAIETALVSSYNRGGGGGAEEETVEELRTVVGRMLWEECWGRFCTVGANGRDERGAPRWWEDSEVMEECVRMGTTWEVLVVGAVMKC